MSLPACRQSWLALLMAVFLLFSTVGCGGAFEEILDFLEDWADIHDVNPKKVSDVGNLVKRTASDSTGNEMADAALGAVDLLKNFHEAEQAMEVGRRNRSMGGMLKAIDRQPNDWSYRTSAMALAVEMYDLDMFERQREQRYSRAPYYKMNAREKLRMNTQTIDELESSRIKTNRMTPELKLSYYKELFEAYDSRAELTGSKQDKEMANQYRSLARP